MQFETQTQVTNKVSVMSSYDSTNTNNDLAIVWLNSDAPVMANRYDFYRSSAEIGQTMTMVGYGELGTGASGELMSYAASPIRQKASNQFYADASTLKNVFGSLMTWTPATGTQLVADFDNGSTAQDALSV